MFSNQLPFLPNIDASFLFTTYLTPSPILTVCSLLQQSTLSTKNGIDSADSGQDSNKHNTISESRAWDDVIHREIKQSEFELDTDYLEMIIQVKKVCMLHILNLLLFCGKCKSKQ